MELWALTHNWCPPCTKRCPIFLPFHLNSNHRDRSLNVSGPVQSGLQQTRALKCHDKLKVEYQYINDFQRFLRTLTFFELFVNCFFKSAIQKTQFRHLRIRRSQFHWISWKANDKLHRNKKGFGNAWTYASTALNGKMWVTET